MGDDDDDDDILSRNCLQKHVIEGKRAGCRSDRKTRKKT
jgi:hypothetical protein